MPRIEPAEKGLWRFYFPEGLKSFRANGGEAGAEPSPENTASALDAELKKLGFGLEGRKTLDLGSGHGFFLSQLYKVGCRGYGIEKHHDRSEYALQKFNEISIPKDFVPIIINGDYLDEKDFSFPDGSTLGDMDFFYCFSYQDFHAKAVLARLSHPRAARIGSIAYIGDITTWHSSWLKEYDELAEQLGFKFYTKESSDLRRDFFVRESIVDSPKLRKRSIDTYRKEAGI